MAWLIYNVSNLCYYGNQIIEPLNLHKKQHFQSDLSPFSKVVYEQFQQGISNQHLFLKYKKKKKKMLQNKAKFRLPWQPNPQTVSDFT